MKTYLMTFLGAITGLFVTACNDDNEKKSTLPGVLPATGQITCAAIKDTSIRYKSDEPCQPGFIKVEAVKPTPGPPDVPVEL